METNIATPASLAGRVAVITGAARGQGRSHAIALAERGADVVLVDAVQPIDNVEYAMAQSSDLSDAAALVEATGRRARIIEADVRDESFNEKLGAAVAELGRLDIVVANAGVCGPSRPFWEISRDEWNTVLDVNLTGVWQTIKFSIPHLIAAGNGGSIIATSSIAGLTGVPNLAHYTASKHGLVGLIRVVANEVAEYGIRANTVHPTSVPTPMIDNPQMTRMFRPDLEDPSLEDGIDVLKRVNLLPVPWVESSDISAAVCWLASDDSRYVTGAAIPVDAGMLAKYSG
ncbi:NAD(P)-dependent oxidoreductase [Tsukamurella asaccharolytica]|uniref:NAD(P)-dependent oxidoreductase n=1 Tax=Tsukamurella asaccharolytica TaxID=2592067 RepID=A0A5C5R5W7_9ACTN|nr:mycofactocin-coupled SDR family oxidoreductase [Tsukamurella asaccharolytica]TWS18439.1 NAD(P)-dependent oxidoreductase [Tsukamurella asaccharolytica]